MNTHALRIATMRNAQVTALANTTLFAALLVACGGGGSPAPATLRTTIGPAGGTVTSADGRATLTVPAGALTTTITASLTAITEGFGPDPLIVPGTVYKLDVSDTALAQSAELTIAQPVAALVASSPIAVQALGRSDSRLHRQSVIGKTSGFTDSDTPLRAPWLRPSERSVVVDNGFLNCEGGFQPGDDVPAGGRCEWKKSVWPNCPPQFVKFAIQYPNLLDIIVCSSQPAPQPQIAQLGPNQSVTYLSTVFSANNLRGAAKINVLSAGIYGLLVDKIKPTVQLSAVVTPAGANMATVTLTAQASDNVGVKQLKLEQLNITLGQGPLGPQSFFTYKPLAQFTSAPYTWTSAPQPVADVYKDLQSYVATAADAAGNLGIASASVNIPSISSFTASSPTVPFGGGSVTLAWAVTSPEAFTLSIDNGVGDVTGQSSKTVNLTATTTYKLTATNLSGSTTATATVTVLPAAAPMITSFSATPASLPAGGGAVTLNWATTNAESVSIDNGIGVVTGTSKVVNVVANTTFTLTATNASGTTTAQTSVVVATNNDRFVDPVAGLDTNACSQAAPCKTIGKAMTGAPTGSAVYLADGSYPSSNSATIPDGVALRASHPGTAFLNFVTLTATGSASLNGVVFDIQGQSCSSISASSSTGTPTLAITGVLFKCAGVINIGGNVKAVMTPGLLANGLYTALPSLYASFLNLSGTAELLIQGGILDFSNFGQGQFGPGMLSTTGNSKLTLDAVTVRNLKQQAFVIAGSSSVVLRNGTVMDHVGDTGQCGASAAIVVAEHGTLTMDHATVSNGPSVAICIGSSTTPLPQVQLVQSTISGMGGSAIATTTGTSADAQLTADGLALTNNGRGISWTSSSAAASLTLSNVTVTGNTIGGMTVSNGALKLRNSTVSNNGAEGGLALYGSPAADLGTAASPGGNTFTGNSGPQLNSIVDVGQTVNAVGNTWTPNIQGADANGRYSLPPTFAPVAKAGPTIGANYQIYNTSTLNL